MTAANKVKSRLWWLPLYFKRWKGFVSVTKVYKEYTEGEDSDDDTESSDYFENEKS